MMTSRSVRTALSLGLAAACVLAAALAGGEPAGAEMRRPRIDAAIFGNDRQAQLLDRALAELRPAEPGQPQLWFVGFGGYGSEAVFKREVLAVRQLFDERFGTRARSIVLINHATTAGATPLASARNLERALQHLGGLMDRDRGLLFLFLTSHGDKRVLAVEMPGLRSEHLTPGRLKGMLDRSGIRNRIVVVSACHSGSFIPSLADPTTLVITAAHADRASFGCDDKRQWTYFGDAYFNQALRREGSFRHAFEQAKRLIRKWEARLRATPSLPQIAGGEALAPLLEAIQRAD